MTITHNDPTRPAFGYERPRHGKGSRFDSALDRMELTRESACWVAEDIADAVVVGAVPDPNDVNAYRKRKAAAVYARAVYDVEAAAIRASSCVHHGVKVCEVCPS